MTKLKLSALAVISTILFSPTAANAASFFTFGFGDGYDRNVYHNNNIGYYGYKPRKKYHRGGHHNSHYYKPYSGYHSNTYNYNHNYYKPRSGFYASDNIYKNGLKDKYKRKKFGDKYYKHKR